MKKRISIVLAVLFFLFFAACTGSGGWTNLTAAPEPTGQTTPADTTAEPREPLTYKEVYDPETDFDNRFGNGQDSLVETEDAYYFASFCASYLYYYDKASGERGVLCGKPECTHDSTPDNKSCNGYVGLIGTMGCWDGRLHYVTDSIPGKVTLMSVKLDGTDKRADTALDIIIDDIWYTPQRFDYHRGRLYGWCVTDVVTGGEPKKETCILSLDPNTGATQKIYSIEADHGYDTTLFYFGKYIYFYLGYIEATDNDGWITHLELRRLDTETEETEDVFISDKDGYLGSRMNFLVASEDLIYLMPLMLPEGESGSLYKLEGGELSIVFDFDTDGIGFVFDGVAFVGNPSKKHMEIRRLDGSLIYSGKWDLGTLDETVPITEPTYYFSSVFGDENELIICLRILGKKGEHNTGVCLVRYDLTGDEPAATVLAYDPW